MYRSTIMLAGVLAVTFPPAGLARDCLAWPPSEVFRHDDDGLKIRPGEPPSARPDSGQIRLSKRIRPCPMLKSSKHW